MRLQSLAYAIGLSFVMAGGTQAGEVPSPQECARITNALDRTYELARLCSQAVYRDGDVDGADAACPAAADRFNSIGSEDAARAALTGRFCVPADKVRRGLRAAIFVRNFIQFRQDNSVPMPPPLEPERL